MNTLVGKKSKKWLLVIGLILALLLIFFMRNKFMVGFMTVSKRYYITENLMVIYDAAGEKYSVLPAGISLYPQGKRDDGADEFIMYINYQGSAINKHNATKIIMPLYLSEIDENFKRENDVILTRRDIIRLLQRNNISKEDFADIIRDFKREGEIEIQVKKNN